MDREGEFCFALRPQSDGSTRRLLCEVKVQENVKLVTLRSTYQIENLTLYPIEVTLVDDKGRPLYSLEKIGSYLSPRRNGGMLKLFAAPGQYYPLPIETVGHNRIRIQPDRKLRALMPLDANAQRMLSEGFGYRWSSPIRYDDLLQRKTFTIKCPHSDENESAFRFHAHVQIDANDITLR